MGKIKQGLLGLASLVLATSASASDAKSPHNDYISIGALAASTSNGATIDKLVNNKNMFGVNLSRRLSLNEKEGILFSVTLGSSRDYPKAWLQTNCDFSTIHKNFEFYTGPGLMLLENLQPYLNVHFGARYHFLEGNGFYIGAEIGPIIGSKNLGLQGNIGIGFRFDLLPDKE